MSIPSAVFLDTNVFDKNNYNYASVAIQAFTKVCKELNLTLLLPEPTEQELRRHIEERSEEASKALERAASDIRRKAPFLQEWIGYKRLTERVAPSLKYHRYRTEAEAWARFWGQFKHVRLGYEGVEIKQIMDWYHHTVAPFGKTAEKRKEFPDAIVFAILVHYAKKHGTSIAVVSSDEDFEKACDRSQDLLYFPSLEKLTELLLSRDKRVEAYINAVNANQEFLEDHMKGVLAGCEFKHSDQQYRIDRSKIHAVGIASFEVIAVGDHECTAAFHVGFEAEHVLTWDERDPRDDAYGWSEHTDSVYESDETYVTAKLRLSDDYAEIVEVSSLDVDDSTFWTEKAPRWY